MADEYIRKQDAIRLAEQGQVQGFPWQFQMLVRLPPADVAPVVHAHWIQTSTEDENGNAYYYCSNCGRGESHNPIVEVPYCWKCGAKMNAHGEE